jgi:hypothetical protein
MHMQIVKYHFPKSNILLRQLASQIPNAIYAKYYLILHSSTSIIIPCPRILLNMLVVGPVIPPYGMVQKREYRFKETPSKFTPR